MKLLGYIRVSTSGQSDNFSLDDQTNKIKAYCQTYDHELVNVFQDTFSGATLNREALTQLLEAIKDYDGIIVYKIDRLSRSAKDTLEIVETLRKAGKTLISISELIDISTPQGKLFLTMLSGVAEYEREIIKERVTNGRKAKKATGSYAGGQPKFGFKVKHEFSNDKLVKTLEVNEMEQNIIDLVKRHKRSGKSFNSIATWLNDNGYQTKQGKQFTIMQVKRILA